MEHASCHVWHQEFWTKFAPLTYMIEAAVSSEISVPYV
jgi:hypothetical protein